MAERPILFREPMVHALLAGTKTQTRRVVKMPPSWDCIVYADWGNGFWPYRSDDGESPFYDNNEIPLRCPYGRAGDRLWVRETFCLDDNGHEEWPIFRADGAKLPERHATRKHARWTPCIHMPRWASRILLEITSVRVERLQDISEADAIAEGVQPHEIRQFAMFGASAEERAAIRRDAAVGPYSGLWESINGGGSWEANPWVWVVEFKRV